MSLRVNTFSYTGNGADNRDIAGGSDFTTQFAWNRAQFGKFTAMSWAALGDDKSFRPGITQDLTANYIQFTAGDDNTDGGYEVGSTNFVNSNTRAYVAVTFGGDTSHLVTGSFTGDGVGQTISGLGITPNLIIIKRGGGTTGGCVRISSMPDTKSSVWSAAAFGTTNILREASDSFDVGAGAQANINTGTMHYIALQIPTGQGDVGSYSGNSTDDRDISLASGITPKLVMIFGDATVQPCFRLSSHAAGVSSPFTEAGDEMTDGIKSFASGSFRLGTNANVNVTGNTYYYLALDDQAVAAATIKAIEGLAIASVKEVEGLAIASVKTLQGVNRV